MTKFENVSAANQGIIPNIRINALDYELVNAPNFEPVDPAATNLKDFVRSVMDQYDLGIAELTDQTQLVVWFTDAKGSRKSDTNLQAYSLADIGVTKTGDIVELTFETKNG